jgi:beta-phosphoglucomutase-like phosphatase (HAD superfamily)
MYGTYNILNGKGQMFQGALFDWDGTVVDTKAAHEESWMRLAREEGLYLTSAMFQSSFGCTNGVIIPNAFKWSSDPSRIKYLSDRKEVIYREIVAGDSADKLALPGAVKLVRTLHEIGIPCAVGSSAPMANIEQIVGRLGIADCFQTLITAECVTRGKPDPEVFLKGAQAIGVEARNCVVFEDAVHGVEAGKAAGAKTVAVLTSHPRKSFEGLADMIIESLAEVTIDDLRSLWK